MTTFRELDAAVRVSQLAGEAAIATMDKLARDLNRSERAKNLAFVFIAFLLVTNFVLAYLLACAWGWM